MKTLNSIITGDIKINPKVTKILKELVNENLSIDLDTEDIETTSNAEITDKMITEIQQLIRNHKNKWDYFDVMKILNIA